VAVAAVAKRKKRRKSGSQWGWRLAGIILCAFFALGVMTGLSRPGRTFALRLESLLNFKQQLNHSALLPGGYSGERRAGSIAPNQGSAVALVERADGFYVLEAQGSLHGPVMPAQAGDLPVISGIGAANANGMRLLRYAGVLVRAEAELSGLVSEIRVGADDTATLFLERPHAAVVVDLDDSDFELLRAAKVMRLWNGHEDVIDAVDLTTPGQAVVRLRPDAAMKTGSRAASHNVSLPSGRTTSLAQRPRETAAR
jgi:hypothetical protein